MKIYTRRGDDGTTGLLHGGRVPKTSPRPTAYGSVDEAQAAIGVDERRLLLPAIHAPPLDQLWRSDRNGHRAPSARRAPDGVHNLPWLERLEEEGSPEPLRLGLQYGVGKRTRDDRMQIRSV